MGNSGILAFSNILVNSILPFLSIQKERAIDDCETTDDELERTVDELEHADEQALLATDWVLTNGTIVVFRSSSDSLSDFSIFFLFF